MIYRFSLGVLVLLSCQAWRASAAEPQLKPQEIGCEFHFGRGDDPKAKPRLPISDEDARPVLRLDADPARCDRTTAMEFNEALETGQKLCLDASLIGIRNKALRLYGKKAKSPPQDSPSSAIGVCECPECENSLKGVVDLVKDVTRLAGSISADGFVPLSSAQVEKALAGRIALYQRIRTEAQAKKVSDSCKVALDMYVQAAVSELDYQRAGLEKMRKQLAGKGSYWDVVDSLGGEAALSTRESLAYLQELKAGSGSHIDRRIGELLEDARNSKSPSRKATARMLQTVISQFHAEDVLSGTFITDDLIGKRTISDVRKLLESPKTRNEFARRLEREGVRFTEDPATPTQQALRASEVVGQVQEAVALGEEAPGGQGHILADPKNPEGAVLTLTSIPARPLSDQEAVEPSAADADRARYDVEAPRRLHPDVGFVGRTQDGKVRCNVIPIFAAGSRDTTVVVPRDYHPSMLDLQFGGKCPNVPTQ